LSFALGLPWPRSLEWWPVRVTRSEVPPAALAVGAHPLGPANNVAQVIDVVRGTTIGSFEFTAPTFTADVANTSSAQRIVFVADGHTANLNLP
jgi:hypothetical protein